MILKEELKKVAKGVLIAVVGAIVTYFTNYAAGLGLSPEMILVVNVVFSALTNFVKQLALPPTPAPTPDNPTPEPLRQGLRGILKKLLS